jgi:hypothetical protein
VDHPEEILEQAAQNNQRKSLCSASFKDGWGVAVVTIALDTVSLG